MAPESVSSEIAPDERVTEQECGQQHPVGSSNLSSGPSSPRKQCDREQTADAGREQPTDAASLSQDQANSDIHSSSTLTESQQHHMRSSPPIQPGEQHHAAKLPSFSEFLHTTRAVTPPRTPSHRNGSVENSPRTKPLFDDVAWSGDHSRRRFDTLGDIYAHQPTDSRRMSSAIDPSLAYGSPRPSQHATAQSVALEHHHRPSHSYPPPLSSMHANASSSTQARHHSSPVPASHAPYSHPPALHSLASQAAYRRPSTQAEAVFERPRPGYYQESHPSGYSYERGPDYHYGGPVYHGAPHSAYETSYHDIRFQQHVGLDHNAFNRKRRGNLPKDATNILKEWFAANRASPYPTEDQKILLCNRTNLSLNQVSNWFINARRRAPHREQRESANPSA
ncbi:hypothetical protein NX059_005809 [Plenodomus lindquistii]|nr:hypothetical protein NX059_005809 [Plenodomus lindquistii]